MSWIKKAEQINYDAELDALVAKIMKTREGQVCVPCGHPGLEHGIFPSSCWKCDCMAYVPETES